MRSSARNVGLCVLIMIAAIYAHYPVSVWWFHVAIEGLHSSSSMWMDPARFNFAILELLWGISIGVLVAALVRAPKPVTWAIVCGIVGTLFLLASKTNHFFPNTPLSAIVWAKLAYVMPILGAALGAVVVMIAKGWGKHPAAKNVV